MAEILAGALGIPLEFANQIVESAPIILLKGLPPERAAAALEAMAPAWRAGAEIAATDKDLPNMGEINWPRPPRLRGPPYPQPRPSFRPGEPSLN